MRVSILMLTHNAPLYAIKSIVGIKKTKFVKYELIVMDNRSNIITRLIIKCLYHMRFIDKLIFNKKNHLFAKGNNMASVYCANDTTHYLLLNSDVKIIRDDWLKALVEMHPKSGGISSYGAVLSDPKRADGYCFLIDKILYDKYKLDENFEWWWSVTKLESQILSEGLPILAVVNHECFLHHYGGASGNGFINAKGMNLEISEVMKWFDSAKGKVTIINKMQ